MDRDESMLSVLDRKICMFKPINMCMKLANKLFQKAPQLLEDLHKILDTIPPSRSSQRLWDAQQFIKKRILAAIEEKENYGLPRKLENYLSFLDLSWIALTKNDNNTYTWHTFVLQDYDHSTLSDIPIGKLRRRLKQFLPEDNLSSVQMEFEERDNLVTEVYFRVAMVKKTKRGLNDEKNLMKKAGSFIVFFPREPYFYTNKPEPDPVIFQAFCSTVNSTGYVPLPLSGPNFDSLRELRLRRDKRCEENLTAEKEPNPVANVLHMEADPFPSNAEKLPILNKLTLSCTAAKFQGEDILRSYHGNRKWPSQVKNLDMEVTFSGPHVFKSLKEMACDKNCSVLEEPLPNWVQKSINRGRNVNRLTCINQDQESIENADEESVAGSEMTILIT